MRNTMPFRYLIASALSATLACSFGQNPDLPQERHLLLTSWAEQMLFPRYQATLDGLQQLSDASKRLCEAPSGGTVRSG